MNRISRSLIVGVLYLSGGAASAQTPPATAGSALPRACLSSEHRQFDFWLGHWEVFQTGKDKLVARSHIEKLYDGCAVHENWMPLANTAGGSLNTYRPDEQIWRQTWVDSGNSHVDFKGGLVGGAMVIAGMWNDVNGPGKHGYVRITYSRQPDGSVRQFGEIADAEGRPFKPYFDFTYRPSKDIAPAPASP